MYTMFVTATGEVGRPMSHFKLQVEKKITEQKKGGGIGCGYKHDRSTPPPDQFLR